MNYVRCALVVATLVGCDQQPASDSPFRHLQSVVQTTQKWLGFSSNKPGLESLASSRVDEFEGRLRRRLDIRQSAKVTQAELRADLLKRAGEKQLTERMHIGSVVLSSDSADHQILGIALYSRDGRGWTGQPCDHMRVQLRGEKDFDVLRAELEKSP